MSYLGEKPAQTLAAPTSQFFNGDGSTVAFTLNRAVNVAEDLDVFVNNVRQEPGVGKSYTATGTTLTFSAAPPTGTGNVYVIYRGLAEVTTRLEHFAGNPLAATTGTFSSTVTGTKFTTSADKTKTEMFQINEQTVSNDVTIAATENASVTGPITVATGVTITVATGGTLVTL